MLVSKKRMIKWGVLLAIIVSAWIILAFTWNSQPSTLAAYQSAEKAISYRDIKALRGIVTANPAIVKLRLDYDGGTLLHYAASVPSPDKSIVQIMDYLLVSGASINAIDDQGRTPLHVICRLSANTDVIEYLLKNGADAKVRDRTGMLPIDYIEKTEYGIPQRKIFERYK